MFEAISGQYHGGSVAAGAPQAVDIMDGAAAAATTVTAASAPQSQPPEGPDANPSAAPLPAAESSINNTTGDMQSVPAAIDTDLTPDAIHNPPAVPEASRAVAPEATGATVPAAGTDSADRPHGGAPVPVAAATPAEQDAAAPANGDAIAAAAQAVPSNVNVSIRIFSPGNDGSVSQTNVAAPSALPVSPAAAAPENASTSSGVTPAPTPAVPTAPTTWVWNWTWESTAAGCASTAAPATPASSVAGSTWTWNWVWRCAPKLASLPDPISSIIPPLPDLPPNLAMGLAGAGFEDLAAGLPTVHGAGAVHRRPAIRRTLATYETSAAGHKMWMALGAPSTARGRGGADSGADTAPAVARVIDSNLGDLFHSPLTASVAAAAVAGAGGSGPGGLGVGAAALLAAFVLFAPQLLIPLRTAAARRLSHVSARRDRPG